MTVEWALVGAVGGLGGWILARWAADRRKPAPRQPLDRFAELERLLQTYRTEVTDLQNLVERRYRREKKAEQRAAEPDDPSTEPSTAFPQGENGDEASLLLQANLARFMAGRK